MPKAPSMLVSPGLVVSLPPSGPVLCLSPLLRFLPFALLLFHAGECTSGGREHNFSKTSLFPKSLKIRPPLPLPLSTPSRLPGSVKPLASTRRHPPLSQSLHCPGWVSD